MRFPVWPGSSPWCRRRPFRRRLALGWLAAMGTAGGLAALGLLMLRRRKRRPVEPRRLTPEEIAEAALAALLAENLPTRGLVKEFYLRLTGIVRQYVEETTGIRAPEQTTEEFLREIRTSAVFPPERSVRLADFLESADLVKYAGQMPAEGQIDQAIARAARVREPRVRAGCRRAGRLSGTFREPSCFRERLSLLFLVLVDPGSARARPDLVAPTSPAASGRGLLKRGRSQGAARDTGAAAPGLAAVSLRPGCLPGDCRAGPASGGQGRVPDRQPGDCHRACTGCLGLDGGHRLSAPKGGMSTGSTPSSTSSASSSSAPQRVDCQAVRTISSDWSPSADSPIASAR